MRIRPGDGITQTRSHWWWRPGWRPGRRMFTFHLVFDGDPRFTAATEPPPLGRPR